MNIGPAFFASGTAPAAWRTIFDWTALTTGSNSGWSAYTQRTVIGASSLGGSGTKLRITLKAAAGGVIDKSYVQIAAASGDVYDFASTPVQILFGGSGSVTLANNTPVLSDELTFSFDGTVALVFAFHSVSIGNIYTQVGATNRSASNEYYLSGDSATTVDTSGMTATSAALINKLELYG